MKKRLCTFFAIISLAAMTAICQSPKREFRSVWMAGMNIDWPALGTSKGTSASAISSAKAEMTAYLDKLKSQNFTTICFHVRPRADAYYKSSYEPWSGDLTGTRGKNPGWDPLEWVVKECHKRGMECYAWVNPFRVTAKGDFDRSYTTSFDKQWKENGWLLNSGNWTIFNPAIPEARQHCLNVIKEIYTNYAVDGLLFDDYFYPGDGMPGYEDGTYDEDSEDYDLWQERDESMKKMSLYDWRRNNVNTFVKEVYDEIQKTRPDLRFGIGPAGVGGASASKYKLTPPSIQARDWMYDKIFCDPLAWLNDGSIDFISPQVYWPTTRTDAPFGPLCEWWSMVGEHFNRHTYISAAAYKLPGEMGGNNEKGWSQMAKQVDLTRSETLNNAPGMIYYNTKSVNGPAYSGLGDYLLANSYTSPSLVPVVDWKNHSTYSAPKGLAYSSGSLSWNATAGATAKSIIRYTVYAVPSDVSMEAAMTSDNDGLSNEYLLGVSYATSYTIPSDKRSKHWYAVCVYDGYGNESDPATHGYSSEKSETPVLTAPADGARADWETTFRWNQIQTATYRLQIASDAAFTNIIVDRRNLTTNSETVAFDNMTVPSTMYWHVSATQTGKLSATSASRSLLAPQKAPAAKPVLTAPAKGSTFNSDAIKFEWTCSDATASLTLQIVKTGNDFSRPVYSRDIKAGATSATVATSSIGMGNFDWRVVAGGDRLISTPSDVSSFTIKSLPITEDGYTVKNDGSTYPAYKSITLENLWMRSSKSGFANMTFKDPEGKGLYNRGMVATENAIYVSGRDGNGGSAEWYLNVYNPENGSLIRKLTLTGGASLGYGCNDVFKDSNGNICISNLVLKSETPQPLNIYRVNTETGALTLAVSLTTAGTYGRIDHVAVTGDVASGNFTVIAAPATLTSILTWNVTNGNAATAVSHPVSAFRPTKSSHFGIAPRIRPVSATEVYVDGGSTFWSLYDISSATRTSALGVFPAGHECEPENEADNGGAFFTLNNYLYNVYSHCGSETGSQFRIARYEPGANPAANKFRDMAALWLVPEHNLGTVISTTQSSPVDVVVTSPATANIYVYSPGNGLAAYRLSDTTSDIIDGIATENGDDEAHYYNLQGISVKAENLVPGIYIERRGNKTRKVVIR